MNWNRAKTILIIFFAIINTFLLYNLIMQNSDSNHIDDEIVSDTITVLNNNGIVIDSSLISREIHSIETFDADNIINDYYEFAKKILGDDINKISENVYIGKFGKVEFSGDKFIITVSPEKDIFINEENCMSFLNMLGISISDYEHKEGKFKKRVNDFNVFSSEISFNKNSSGMLEISGIWFENNSDTIFSKTELKPVTSALIDFLSSEDKPGGTAEITKLELGYMVYEPEIYHKSIVPIPAWKIELSNNGVAYVDARSLE